MIHSIPIPHLRAVAEQRPRTNEQTNKQRKCHSGDTNKNLGAKQNNMKTKAQIKKRRNSFERRMKEIHLSLATDKNARIEYLWRSNELRAMDWVLEGE